MKLRIPLLLQKKVFRGCVNPQKHFKFVSTNNRPFFSKPISAQNYYSNHFEIHYELDDLLLHSNLNY